MPDKKNTFIDRIKPKSRAKYDLMYKHISELNSLKDLSIAQLAKQLDIDYNRALAWYSHMLKSIHAENVKKELESKQIQLIPVCPSCGKMKHEVTDLSICRDVFHYL